jgi:hypothetical protein
MLDHAVKACNAVPPEGISDPSDRTLAGAAEAETADGCEVIPGHDLIPVRSNSGSVMTSHGIRLFASRLDEQSSDEYLRANYDRIERFSFVLKNIADVFQLRTECMAIYYAANGRTIAFNADRALHFNFRFFVSLHDAQGRPSLQAFAYWFTTACHELAHNFASGHGKLHEHYMESFFSEYSPRLMDRMRSLELI